MRVVEMYGGVWIHGSFKERSAAVNWCIDTFGASGHNPKCRWRVGSWSQHQDKFSETSWLLFKHDSDKMMFMLRWKS